MFHNSSRNLTVFFGFLLLLPFLSFPVQTAAQPKKPRTETRALEQPPAEKEKKPASQNEIAVQTPRPANNVKKIMITDFDARGIVKWWGANWDIGSLFANSVIGPISRTEGYEVVERARMKEVFDELNLSESERFSQAAVTKAGRQLGADYILFGFLTDFTRKKGGFGPYKEVSARIAFSARLVDVATGKVFKSTEVNYVSPKQKDFSLTAENEFNPNDPEFLQTLFGKAISESSQTMVTQLTGENVAQTNTVPGGGNNGGAANSTAKKDFVDPAAGTTIQGKVADVTGGTVTINRGRQHGVREGQFFAVSKTGKEIRDPDTGAVIKRQTEEIARLKITKVDDMSAEGVVVSGDISLFGFGTEVARVEPKKP